MYGHAQELHDSDTALLGEPQRESPDEVDSFENRRPRPVPGGLAPARRPDRIRLPTGAYLVGQGQHRSGWPYALASLAPLVHPKGVLVDDFVERTFCYGDGAKEPYREPWVGVFHHPPGHFAFTLPNHRLPNLFAREVWRESGRHLLHAVALSHHLGDWLREALDVPVTVLRHPTETPGLTWSPARYLANPAKAALQIGFYLRNPWLIHQIPDTAGHRRVRVYPRFAWCRDYQRTLRAYWEGQGTRPWTTDAVEEWPRLSNAAYDTALSENVVVTELFGASANNLVVECLVRNTPIVVNRHPAVIEYLGPHYPLFFDELAEIPRLLQPSAVLAAHGYLSARPKAACTGPAFLAGFRSVLQSL